MITLRFEGDREKIIEALEIAAHRYIESAEYPGPMGNEDRRRDQARADDFRRIAGDMKATRPAPPLVVRDVTSRVRADAGDHVLAAWEWP